MKTPLPSRSAFSGPLPVATIAAYGPDDTFASKLVVSVFDRPRRDPIEMRTWMTVEADARQDMTIAAEVAGFLREHGVERSVFAEGIIGCPHEEGVDYPHRSKHAAVLRTLSASTP